MRFVWEGSPSATGNFRLSSDCDGRPFYVNVLNWCSIGFWTHVGQGKKLHCDRFRATIITSKCTITFLKLMCKKMIW